MITQSDQDSPHYLDWSSLSLMLDDCNLERKIIIQVLWYLQRVNSVNTQNPTKTNSNWIDLCRIDIYQLEPKATKRICMQVSLGR